MDKMSSPFIRNQLRLYSVLSVAMILSSSMFVTGVATPFWLKITKNTVTIHAGVWMSCQDGGVCWSLLVGYDSAQDPSVQFRVVQALEAAGAVFLVVCNGYWAVTLSMCSQRTSRRDRSVEDLAFFGAMCGFSGVVVLLAGWYGQQNSGITVQLAWSFFFTLVGSVSATVLAGAMSILRTTLVHFQTTQYSSGTRDIA